MTRVQAIHQTIRHVYEAAISPDDWSTVLAEVAQVMGAQAASLFAHENGAPTLAVFAGLEPAHAHALQYEFEMRLPRWISAIPPGTPRRQTSEISDSDFKRTFIYNEVVKPAGMFYGLVAPLVCLPGRQIHFSTGRNLGLSDFGDDDIESAKLIVPHLTTAVLARNRLAAAELRAKGAYEALSHMKLGVILLDARMRPLYVNPRAEALGLAGDGLKLSQSEVSALLPGEAKRLGDAIAMAIGMTATGRDASDAALKRSAAAQCRVSRRPPRRPLIVHVLPVDATDMLDGINSATRAILFITDTDLSLRIEPMDLVEQFDLTRREAALAALLARGTDLTQAATQLGIGAGTARGYLKHIFMKTDTHRQTELVALLLHADLQSPRPSG